MYRYFVGICAHVFVGLHVCTHTYTTCVQVCEVGDHLLVYVSLKCKVAGIVSVINPPEEGSTVVSWPPPVPPNGDILYYNVRITRADNGELLVFIEQLGKPEVDIANYDYEPGVEYNVEVWQVLSSCSL